MSSLTNRGASGDDSASINSTKLANDTNLSSEIQPRTVWRIFRGGRELRCELHAEGATDRVAMTIFVDGERLSTQWFEDYDCAAREAQHWKEFTRANLTV